MFLRFVGVFFFFRTLELRNSSNKGISNAKSPYLGLVVIDAQCLHVEEMKGVYKKLCIYI